MHNLESLGWNASFQASWEALDQEGCVPARLIADFGSVLKVATPEEHQAELAGRLLFTSEAVDRPKVGDWVAVALSGTETATVEAVLPRHSEISRQHKGKRTDRQVLAANIDLALIVQALDHDFSPERIERYLFQLQNDNVTAVLVLNKADEVQDLSGFLRQTARLNLPVFTCSARTGQGMEEVAACIKSGQTAVLLGSSGVGKSTITNYLLGQEIQATAAVRDTDQTGRHTTTHRELFRLANGGLLIDTPGIRELQLAGTDEELAETFDDITALTAMCRYNNCSHTTEAGCAVQQALANGGLNRQHFNNYLKMQQELAASQAKTRRQTLVQKQAASSKLRKLRRRNAEDD